MAQAFRWAMMSIAGASVLSGCTTTQSTYRGAVAYNRAFDQARNEILLLNILRARDRYPQQYSTISQIVGSMRSDVSVTPNVANVIGEAAFALGGNGTMSFRNPSVTITPLETKEFRAGMMKAIRAEYVNDLLAQRWTPEVVENLTVEGIGQIAATEPDRAPGRQIAVVPVAPADLSKMLLDPSTSGVRTRVVGNDGDKVLVQLSSADTCIDKLPTRNDCGLARQQAILRSPAGMVQYLGKLLREGPENPYFRVSRGTDRPPSDALVSTKFAGETYYIDRKDKLSLETLTLLADIIGFQTTDAVLDSGKPTLAIAR